MAENKKLRIGISGVADKIDGGVLFTHSIMVSDVRMIDPEIDVFVMEPTWNRLKAEEMVNSCDGVIMTGGVDVNPAMYDEEKHETTDTPDPLRDAFDCLVIDNVIKNDIPFLGVCRSNQIVNVYFGGTLYQDLKSQCDFACDGQFWDWKLICNIEHNVDITGGPLEKLYGKRTLPVNSAHHQAVKEVGKGLKVGAVAEDGLVEGLYLEDPTFFATVQWHPEDLFWMPEHKLLFEHFIDVCREKAGK